MSIWLQKSVLMQPRTSLGKSDVSWNDAGGLGYGHKTVYVMFEAGSRSHHSRHSSIDHTPNILPENARKL
jgi:hypothetical protein